MRQLNCRKMLFSRSRATGSVSFLWDAAEAANLLPVYRRKSLSFYFNIEEFCLK